jgi:hypothetical protein
LNAVTTYRVRGAIGQVVFVDAAYQAKETWYGSDGSAFIPGCTTSWAATPKCMATPPYSAFVNATRCATRTGSLQPGTSTATSDKCQQKALLVMLPHVKACPTDFGCALLSRSTIHELKRLSSVRLRVDEPGGRP